MSQNLISKSRREKAIALLDATIQAMLAHQPLIGQQKRHFCKFRNTF